MLEGTINYLDEEKWSRCVLIIINNRIWSKANTFIYENVSVEICIINLCHFYYIIENKGHTPAVFPVGKSSACRKQKFKIKQW